MTSLKVSLKEILWPSFSVSTSTPSQSKSRAEGRVAEEDEAEHLIPPERDPLCVIVGFDLKHLPMYRDLEAFADKGVALNARAALGMNDAADSFDWIEEGEDRESLTVAIVCLMIFSLSLSISFAK